MPNPDFIIIDRPDFGGLFDALQALGYTVVGPRVRDGAIVYDELENVDDLPVGWTDEQEAGHYRLRQRDDAALFGYAVGPQSWKKFLHPPRLKILDVARSKEGQIRYTREKADLPKRAFLGVRSCELHAIGIQDRVFLGGDFQDLSYRERREKVFTIAVNCGVARATCFCASMKTGPSVSSDSDFDIELTELLDGGGHRFLCRAKSDSGRAVLEGLRWRKATPDDLNAMEALVSRTATMMGRQMDSDGVRDLLIQNLEHPRWDALAERCLTCANCTMVCPTCFCSTVEDVTDLTGDHAERWRRWDSCFTLDFSHLAGGSARQSTRSRYRQWLTHKLATWYDQFDTSGCVGCGRCITWCPVGIDITEEIREMGRSASNKVPV